MLFPISLWDNTCCFQSVYFLLNSFYSKKLLDINYLKCVPQNQLSPREPSGDPEWGLLMEPPRFCGFDCRFVLGPVIPKTLTRNVVVTTEKNSFPTVLSMDTHSHTQVRDIWLGVANSRIVILEG